MHLMIDLETLSLQPNAVVTQLGYAVFFFEYDGIEIPIIDSGCFFLDPEIQIKNHRHISWSTIKWWMEQSDEARDKFKTEGLNPQHALMNFIGRFNWTNIEGVWANGSNFDIPILEDLFFDCDIKIPWHYRAPRDCRTMAMLAEPLVTSKDVLQIKNPIKHSAKHDAIAQVKWMQNCYAAIRGLGLPHANG